MGGSHSDLFRAAGKGSIDAIEAAVSAGADVNEERNGVTPLVVAVRMGHLLATRTLLKHGADANRHNCLHAALGRASLPVIRSLLDAGADPWAVTAAGLRAIDSCKSNANAVRFFEEVMFPFCAYVTEVRTKLFRTSTRSRWLVVDRRLPRHTDHAPFRVLVYADQFTTTPSQSPLANPVYHPSASSPANSANMRFELRTPDKKLVLEAPVAVAEWLRCAVLPHAEYVGATTNPLLDPATGGMIVPPAALPHTTRTSERVQPVVTGIPVPVASPRTPPPPFAPPPSVTVSASPSPAVDDADMLAALGLAGGDVSPRTREFLRAAVAEDGAARGGAGGAAGVAAPLPAAGGAHAVPPVARVVPPPATPSPTGSAVAVVAPPSAAAVNGSPSPPPTPAPAPAPSATPVTPSSPPSRTEPPSAFLCPITLEVMEQPVVASDGFTYERSAIEAWLQSHATSPSTNEDLPHAALLIPNHSLRSQIVEWQEAHAHVALNQ